VEARGREVTGMGGWLERIRQRIDRDLGDPRLGHPGISFIRYAEWIRSTGTRLPAGDIRDADPDEPVCVAGGRSFPVSLRDGVEAAVVDVASALQDDVMDRLGRPWPFVNLGELGGAVLEPELDGWGMAVWASKRGIACPVGYLQSTLGALRVIA